MIAIPSDYKCEPLQLVLPPHLFGKLRQIVWVDLNAVFSTPCFKSSLGIDLAAFVKGAPVSLSETAIPLGLSLCGDCAILVLDHFIAGKGHGASLQWERSWLGISHDLIGRDNFKGEVELQEVLQGGKSLVFSRPRKS